MTMPGGRKKGRMMQGEPPVCVWEAPGMAVPGMAVPRMVEPGWIRR